MEKFLDNFAKIWIILLILIAVTSFAHAIYLMPMLAVILVFVIIGLWAVNRLKL